MPNPDEAPSHEGHVDDVGQAHDGHTQVIPGPVWVGEGLPRSAGHGHVIPNPDGSKARCGGPAVCSVCARENQVFPPKATAGYLDERPARPIGVRTRLRSVLRSAFTSEDRAAYFRSDTEDLCPIALPWSSWVEMGRPDRITVTIEPGDRLNGD